MKKFNKQQKKVLDGLFEDVKVAKSRYYKAIDYIEQQARHILEIEIELFHVDGEAVGWGDCGRKYKLYQK